MFYYKKIVSYLDYYEYGEKKKSCGYARLVVKDHEMTLEARIKEAPVREAGVYGLETRGGERRRIGQFTLERGTGRFYACFYTMNLDGNGLTAFAVSGLSIPIDEGRSLETSWSWGLLPDARLFEERRETARTGQSAGEIAATDDKADKEPNRTTEEAQTIRGEQIASQETQTMREEQTASQETQTIREEQTASQEAQTMREEQPPQEEQTAVQTEQAAREIRTQTEREAQEEIPRQEILYDDKWRQLCALYPVCHPFGEHEDYIVIAPKDFIVLRQEYQNLVSNSFLLHSFYQYRHVILGRMGNEAGTYYIGVPGNYVEREKKVAVMFGFEGFAQSAPRSGMRCAASSASRLRNAPQPVEAGAFGYYMKRVEI